MAETPIVESIIEPRLYAVTGTLQMELADQPASVTAVGDQFGNQRELFGKQLVAIASVVQTGRIHARHETRAAGSANGTLAVRMGEGHSNLNETVDRFRANIRIPQGPDGVETLLVSAIPENIWSR
jgi:hypothetical protein